MELARLIEVIGAEVDIKHVGLFNKGTSDKIIIVNYIQIIVSTITEYSSICIDRCYYKMFKYNSD